MLLEGLLGVRLVVLAAYGEHDAALLEFQRVSLHGRIRLALGAVSSESESVDAVLADDSPPDRIVEVEYQNLLRKTEQRPQVREIMVDEHGDRLGGGVLLRQVPETWIIPPSSTELRGNGVEIQDAHARLRPLEHRQIGAQEHSRPSARLGPAQLASAVVEGKVEAVLD